MPVPISEPGRRNIAIYKNRTFYLSMTPKVDGTPVDNTGFVARMQIRASQVETSPVLVSASSATGEITLGGASGEITIRLGRNVTDLLPAPSSAFYDIALFENADATEANPILEGEVEVRPTVTR